MVVEEEEDTRTPNGLSAEQLMGAYGENGSYGMQPDDHIQMDRQLADETTGVLGNTGDILTGIGHGAMDAVDETLQFGAGIADGLVEKAGDLVGKDWDLIEDEKYQGEILQFFPRPVTTAGKLVEDITQFGVGLFGAGKFRRAFQMGAKKMGKAATLKSPSLKNKAGFKVSKALDYDKASKLKKVGIRTGDSALASLVVQDPYEDTLAEVMQNSPSLANPVAKFLANEIDDSEFTRRMKNVGEDILLSVGIEGLVKLVKGTKNAIKPPKEVEKAFKAEEVKVQAEADAGVQVKAFVDGLDEDAKFQVQHVLNAHQAGMAVEDSLHFLPKQEVSTLIDKVAPELKEAFDNATSLKAAGESGTLGAKITKEQLDEIFTNIYKQLGLKLENGVNEKMADVSDLWGTLKGVKDKTTVGSRDTARKPRVKLKVKRDAEGNIIPTPAKKTTTKETSEGTGKEGVGEPVAESIPKIDLGFDAALIKKVRDEMSNLTVKLKGKEPEDLIADYMKIIKDATRGLSGKYYDTPELDKALTEQLRVQVLNPILKDLRGTHSFVAVQESMVKRMSQMSGIPSDEMDQIIAKAGLDVQEASELLMIQEIKINGAWKDMMATMGKLEGLTGNTVLKHKVTAELLLQVDKLSQMSNAASMLESSFGRAMGQRRMAMKSVDDMAPVELRKILDTLGKNPEKSQAHLDELISNLKRADNDLVKSANIAREFGKYQGAEKFMASMTEMWRGALLMNWATNITNMLSGITESFIIPTERLIGSAVMRTWDPAAKEVHDQAWLHFRNMGEGFKHGFAAMQYAFKHEMQPLDPFKGGMIETPGKGMTHHKFGSHADMTHEEMLRNSPYQMTASNWGLKDDSFAGALVNNMGKTFRMSFRFLGAQDEWIKQTTYWASLKSKYQMHATRMVNSGEMTIDEAKLDVMRKMKDHFEPDGFTPKLGKDGNLDWDHEAIQMARDVTHTKEAWDDSIVQNMQRAVNTNPALGIFLPFIRTPMDLVNKAYQRTPLIGMLSKRMKKDFKEGGTKRAQWVGRQMVGTGIVGMGYMAVMDGKLTGKGPDDPRANKIWRQTHQPNSIMVDGKWISYNKMDPAGMLLGVIANGAEAARNQALTEGTDAADVTTAVIMAVTGTIGDKSALRGIINMTTLFSDQVIGKEEATENILEDHVASWVPSILTQVSGAFQDTSYIKEADGFIEKLMRKSPWHQKDLPDRYNWLTGQKEKIPTGNSWGIPMKPQATDWVLKELANLNHGFSGPNRSFGGIDLSSAQFSEWSQLMGTVQLNGDTLMEALQSAMRGSQYDYDPNRQYFQEMYGEEPEQVKLVKRIIRRYKAVAKKELIQNNPNLTPQQEDLGNLFGGY